MAMNTKTMILGGVSLIAMGLGTSAMAQSGKAAAGALEEVVVTAQRRSQNIQDVPLAVTSFSPKTMETAQITNTLDIARVIPNFFAANNVGQASANVYFIRGLGQTQSFPTFEPQVGTYVDDIYISRQNANNFALFGIDQLQVLRGPQGTLFGRNSTGGAIVVTLQKPAADFGGSVEAGVGSYGRFFGRGSVDIPISAEILTKTSVFGTTDDGYVQNLTTGEKMNWAKNWGIREAVRVLPSKYGNVEWNIAADYSRNDAENVLNQPGPGGVDGSGRVSYSGFSKNPGALAKYATGNKGLLGQGALVESGGVTSNLKVGFEAGTLNLITGYRVTHQGSALDFPFNGLGPQIPWDQGPAGQFVIPQMLNNYQLSQEVKWTGDLNERLKYTVGAFYLDEFTHNNFGEVANLAIALQSLFPGLKSFPSALADQYTRNQTTSTAVYAQGDYKVTQALTLTVGGRYTHEEKSVTAEPRGAKSAGFTTADVIAAGWRTKLTVNEFTPRVALEYRINPDVMVFASATKGFQGGGWNGLTGSAAQFNNFGPETVWSYEGGLRSETSDHRLRFNLTGFYEDIKDYQLLFDAPSQNNALLTQNAADMRAYGAEVEATWKPLEALSLTANLGLIKAEFYNPGPDVRATITGCKAGKGGGGTGIVTLGCTLATPVPTPPVTFATIASYDLAIQSYTLTPSVGIQWNARENVDTANLPQGINKAYAMLDLGATLKPTNGPWSITAECRNCTMQNYATANLFGYRYYNTPGIWDVKVQYRF